MILHGGRVSAADAPAGTHDFSSGQPEADAQRVLGRLDRTTFGWCMRVIVAVEPPRERMLAACKAFGVLAHSSDDSAHEVLSELAKLAVHDVQAASEALVVLATSFKLWEEPYLESMD